MFKFFKLLKQTFQSSLLLSLYSTKNCMHTRFFLPLPQLSLMNEIVTCKNLNHLQEYSLVTCDNYRPGCIVTCSDVTRNCRCPQGSCRQTSYRDRQTNGRTHSQTFLHSESLCVVVDIDDILPDPLSCLAPLWLSVLDLRGAEEASLLSEVTVLVAVLSSVTKVVRVSVGILLVYNELSVSTVEAQTKIIAAIQDCQ